MDFQDAWSSSSRGRNGPFKKLFLWYVPTFRQAVARLLVPQEITSNMLKQEGSTKPDVVISINVTGDNAKARYLSRGRDHNDSAMKFQRRYDEYLREGCPVEEHYREAGLIIDVSSTYCLAGSI